MITQLTHKWWMLGLRGLAVMLSGLAALVWPVATLTALRMLFGAYALADGLIIMSQLARPDLDHGRGLRLRGLASIALGVLIGLWSSATAPALVAIVAAWTILARAFKTEAIECGCGQAASGLEQPDRAQDGARALKSAGVIEHRCTKSARSVMIYPSAHTAAPKYMPKICAWCGKVITASYTGGGHGICKKCCDEFKKRAQDDGYINAELRVSELGKTSTEVRRTSYECE